MCLAQGHNAVTPVRLEPAALRSRVKHSTTEPLRSLSDSVMVTSCYMDFSYIKLALQWMHTKCLHQCLSFICSSQSWPYLVNHAIKTSFTELKTRNAKQEIPNLKTHNSKLYYTKHKITYRFPLFFFSLKSSMDA